MPDVPPKETLTPQAAVVAINLTATADPEEIAAALRPIPSIGTAIADGQNRWKACGV